MIQEHYASVVALQKDASLYSSLEGFVEYGSAKKGAVFPLEEQVIEDGTQTYFKVKNEEYYVYYENVLPVEASTSFIPDYYLLSSSNITSHEVTNFYQNDALVFSLPTSMEFHYFYQTDECYTVSYLGQYFDLKKDEVTLTPSEENVTSVKSMSVIEIPELSDNCSDHTCISTDYLKEFLNLLKENEKYTIYEEDYIKWLKGYVSLKENAILLLHKKDDEALSNLLNEYGFHSEMSELKLSFNNKASTRSSSLESLDSYSINQKVTSEEIKKMVNGETIEPPKKVVSETSNITPKGLPSESEKATQIAVLNYHFFYDESIGEWCGEGNCLEVAKFREQLEYLKNNNYKTLTMEEYRAWMYGEMELPARSVLLTVDDGAMGTGKHNGNKLIPLLEEYDMHATLFLITGWWAKENYISKNLDIESHTYDMHKEGQCSGESRGAQMLCSSKEQVMKDLAWSIDITGSNKAFCFPFYAYNASTIQSVKEAGFQLAFIGGSVKSNRNHDKYKIPRYPIHSNITLNQFINMIA